MSDEPIITYIRVSTSGQGRSGLGIEAQRNTLAQFANSRTPCGRSGVRGGRNW